jgi:hypothetical protein
LYCLQGVNKQVEKAKVTGGGITIKHSCVTHFYCKSILGILKNNVQRFVLEQNVNPTHSIHHMLPYISLENPCIRPGKFFFYGAHVDC